jgi:hypothetical protein
MQVVSAAGTPVIVAGVDGSQLSRSHCAGLHDKPTSTTSRPRRRHGGRYTLVAAWAADGISRGSSSETVPAASRRLTLAQRHASRPCHW